MCRRILIPTAVALTLLAVAACDSTSDAAVPDPALSEAAIVGADVVVSGPWNWSETTILDLRPEAVALFGIQPEGPITHLRCAAWGQLGITQSGEDFTGTASQSSWCETAGGNSFDPSQAFPSSLSLEGHLQGRSLTFTVTTGVFPCPYRGVAYVKAGQVTSLTATGHCEVPNDLGNDKIWWTAVRP